MTADTDQVAADHDLVSSAQQDPYLEIVTASSVTLRRVVYAWERRVPIGAMTLMPGEEGIGKTTVGIRLMADLTRGLLLGEHRGKPQHVLIVATEDGIDDVVTPRLQQAGADLDRVHFVRARLGVDGSRHEVILPRDLDAMSEVVRRIDVALIWIDSLVTTLPEDLKSIAYKDVAKVLRKINDWAHQERVAVIAPWHLNKATGNDTAVRIMDSRAFRTAVRSMLLVVPDPDAPEGVTRGIVALDKANAGTLNVPGLRYQINPSAYEVDELDEETGEVRIIATSCGVATWLGEVDGNARDIARSALTPRIEKPDSPEAWLRAYLKDEGETERAKIITAARQEGHGESAIKRAARSLGIVSREAGGQNPKTGAPWRRAFWDLPAQSGHQSVPTPTYDPNEPTGEGLSDLNGPIYAGQDQSVQSGQLGMGRGSDPTAETVTRLGAARSLHPGVPPESLDPLGRCRLHHGHPIPGECFTCKQLSNQEAAS